MLQPGSVPMRLAMLLIVLVSAGAARAELSPCTTSVNGGEVPLFFDPEDPRVSENTTFKENWFGDWGKITCPGYVTLRYLTPDLTDDQRGTFCLQYDRKTKTYTGYSEGERDPYAICRKPSKSFCQRVNASKDTVLALTGLAASATGAAEVAQTTQDVQLLTQDNGAVSLTGKAVAVAGALTRLGSTALAAAAAPAEVGAAAVTVVTVGGLVYLCKE